MLTKLYKNYTSKLYTHLSHKYLKSVRNDRIFFILIFFSHTVIFFFFSPRHKYLFRSEGMNITVRNMEIDLNSNIPQLMLGVLFFQGGTVRQYISAAKYMIILKPL